MQHRSLTFGVLGALVLMLPSCQRSGEPRTPLSAPTFHYVKEKEGGCNNLFLYTGTADDLEVLRISAEQTKLKLAPKQSRTFDLSAQPEGLQVAIDLWEKAPRFRAYCNDISADTKKRATWKAKKGKLILTILGPANPEEEMRKNYKASARLEDVLFEDEAGNRATLKETAISEVLVGWFAG